MSLKAPLTDADIVKMRERNSQRTAEAIQRLGKKYTLHPVHRVTRKTGEDETLTQAQLRCL